MQVLSKKSPERPYPVTEVLQPPRQVGLTSSGSALLLATILTTSLLGWSPPQTFAKQVQLDVALAHPTMLIEDKAKAENHLRISLNGFELPREKDRTPVNIAIVIDKSGSMQGDKIMQARKAAIQAVARLVDSDIVSIITYDSSVQVIVPATKASDREQINAKIQSIRASGNTALHAGVSKGAAEVRKFMDDQRVNRVILLSDGLANVGPQSPAELEALGASLIEEGISVTTMGLGLGYNEDLMSRLALASSGNHVFIEDAENLVSVFQNEFDDVLSVVAQKLIVNATLAEGVRAVKVLNYPAEIEGQNVKIELGQLYSGQERYFVVEVEVPLGEAGTQTEIANVSLDYFNMVTETNDKLTSSIEGKFTNSPAEAEKDVDQEVLAACVIQIANERNRQATELRDEGKVEEARSLLELNADYLRLNFDKTGIESLSRRATLNQMQAGGLTGKDWESNRKAMREQQVADASQQSYTGKGKEPESKPDGKPKKDPPKDPPKNPK